VPNRTDEPITAFSPPKGRQVVVGSVLAWRLNIQEGDTITLETPQGPQNLPVAQVANDYAAGGLTVHMSWELAEQLLGIEGVDAYVVKAQRGRIDEVESALGQIARRHGMLLQSYTDLTGAIEGMMSGVVGSLWGLMALGLVVASFGVVNTLGMNVLEQTRELGLLRVIAMTRRQVRRAVMAQAAMMGFLAVVPGLAAGVLMAYIIHLATLPVIGHPVGFMVRPWLLVAGFVSAMVMVLLAAWIPGQRAARLQPNLALRYE
jgi:putative ABC transport system permease protein